MNKRLRKKKKVQEFVVYGQQITFEINTSYEKFFDECIPIVEGQKAGLYGGLARGKGDFMLELGSDKPALKLFRISKWFRANPNITNYQEVGSLVDVNKE